MNELRIRVKSGKAEIEYHQTVKESLSFSASCVAAHSKSNDQKQLITTIKEMCNAVSELAKQQEGE